VFIRLPAAVSAAFLSLAVSACTSSSDLLDDVVTSSVRPASYSANDRECLARAMFFESHRSSREGLIAVGSVVMNRVKSDEYPDTVCGVVAQKNQFAPGVMTRKMNSKALPDVMAAADAVLKGERHQRIQNAKFFHTAGLNFPYDNMHYVLRAGGNAFYEKRSRVERRANPVRRQSQLVAAGLIENKTTVRVADAQTADPQVKALSFDVEPAKADAIGALIASGTRPGDEE
jgi:spore germination cell wall hydrolase CwlJ-like protein